MPKYANKITNNNKNSLTKSEFRKFLKEHNEAIKEHRLRIWYANQEASAKNVINELYNRNWENLDLINDKLYDLLSDHNLIMSSYNKISRNEGAMTRGTNSNTADGFNVERLESLQKKLINGSFQFSKVKIVEILKKDGKKRKLGIANFDDRIVQENMRMILNAIYEPLFQSLEVNQGFRPNRSTRTCIFRLQETSNGMTTAIEADIKGAYDNVKPNILIAILKKKINDDRFTALVEQGLKVETLTGKITEKKLFGLPQGSIVAPILFNIYMHEFDKHIIFKVSDMLRNINIKENREDNPRSRKCLETKNTVQRIGRAIKKITHVIKNDLDRKIYKGKYKYKDFELYKKLKKERQKAQSSNLMAKGTPQRRKKLMFNYNRYADDFIILTNADIKLAKKIKSTIGEFLKNELDLELSKEKTLITDLKKNRAKFLGFTIYDTKQKKIVKVPRILSAAEEKENPNQKKFARKKLSIALRVGIDKDRVLKKMQKEGIIDKNNKPIAYDKALILSGHQIIEKFNQKLLGFTNYYFEAITMKSSIKRFIFILTRCCENTLAKKYKRSVRELKLKHGPQLKFEYENKYKERKENISLKSYKELTKWAELIATNAMRLRLEGKRQIKVAKEIGTRPAIDNSVFKNAIERRNEIGDIFKDSFLEPDPFLETKFNLRSGYALSRGCSVCGFVGSMANPIELHHLKAVRKGKVTGFKQIMKQINRKTIPVCNKCHWKIHKGELDNKNLRHLVIPDLAAM